MMLNIIENEDIEKLIKKVKHKTQSNKLVNDLQNIKNQGYPSTITFEHMVRYLEDFFDNANNRYRGYGRLMSQTNYVNELNRGGGNDLHRQVGLILKKEIYNNPRYLSAGHFKMLSSVSELKEIKVVKKRELNPQKINQLGKGEVAKLPNKSFFSKLKKKIIKPIKQAIRRRFSF